MAYEYEFGESDTGPPLQITPLGAAIVEAMPNKAKMRTIQWRFKKGKECPTSAVFPTTGAVELFYRHRGVAVTGYEKSVVKSP